MKTIKTWQERAGTFKETFLGHGAMAHFGKEVQDEIDELRAERDADRRKFMEADLMAECTIMLRNDLIEARIVSETVPPMMLTEAIMRHIQRVTDERDHARACLDNGVKILTGIHFLLYPKPINTPDGRTMVFRPKNPDPHEVLQELSERIRAIPDDMLAADAQTACRFPTCHSEEYQQALVADLHKELIGDSQQVAVPMTPDDIYQLAQRGAVNDGLTAIVREVEAHHGIKP